MVLPIKNEPHICEFVKELNRKLGDVEVLLQYEEGISNAVWQGIQKARGDVVVIMDSDGSHNPNDVLPMLTLLNDDVDVVVARRVWNYYSLQRRIISYVCAWLTRNWLGIHLTDPLTAFIVGRREKLFFKPFKGCKFALEILVGLKPNRIREYAVCHVPCKNHKSKMKPQEGIYLLKQLWRLKFGH